MAGRCLIMAAKRFIVWQDRFNRVSTKLLWHKYSAENHRANSAGRGLQPRSKHFNVLIHEETRLTVGNITRPGLGDRVYLDIYVT